MLNLTFVMLAFLRCRFSSCTWKLNRQCPILESEAMALRTCSGLHFLLWLSPKTGNWIFFLTVLGGGASEGMCDYCLCWLESSLNFCLVEDPIIFVPANVCDLDHFWRSWSSSVVEKRTITRIYGCAMLTSWLLLVSSFHRSQYLSVSNKLQPC